MFTEIKIIRERTNKESATVAYSVSANNMPTLENIKNNLHNNFNEKNSFFTNGAIKNDRCYNIGSYLDTNNHEESAYNPEIIILITTDKGESFKLYYNTEEREYAMTAKVRDIFDNYEDEIAKHVLKELNLVL